MFRIVPALSEGDHLAGANFCSVNTLLRLEWRCASEILSARLASLPGLYAPPAGRLLLAIQERAGNSGEAIGCAALRKLEPDACELKRLYVRPAFRGQGAARELVKELIAEARSIGYKRMVLDTLPSMQVAHKLYRTIGFLEIPAYQKNPIPNSIFFGLELS